MIEAIKKIYDSIDTEIGIKEYFSSLGYFAVLTILLIVIAYWIIPELMCISASIRDDLNTCKTFWDNTD